MKKNYKTQRAGLGTVIARLQAIHLSRAVANFHHAVVEMQKAVEAVNWADKTAQRVVGYRGPGITKLSLGDISPTSNHSNWVELRKGKYRVSTITKKEARRRSNNAKRYERVILFER